MVILGVDPGLATVGWGAVEYAASRFHTLAYGTIRTEAGLPVDERLSQIYDGLAELLDRYRPDAMAIEELFWQTNVTTGIVVAEARGVLLVCAAKHGVSIYEYTPMQVKSAVVGYGKAEKKQVMTMTASLLGLKQIPRPDDAADALAIAVCHAHSGASALEKYFNRPTVIGGIPKEE